MEQDQDSNNLKRNQKNERPCNNFLDGLHQTSKNGTAGKSSTEKPNSPLESNPYFSTTVLPNPSISNHELDIKQFQLNQNRMKGVKVNTHHSYNRNFRSNTTKKPNSPMEPNPYFSTKVLPIPSISNHELDNRKFQLNGNRTTGVNTHHSGNINFKSNTTKKPNLPLESNPYLSTKILPYPSISNQKLDNRQFQLSGNRTTEVKVGNEPQTRNGEMFLARHYEKLQSRPQNKNKNYGFNNKTKQDSVIRDTDGDNSVEHQSTLSDYSNYSITKSKNYQEEDIILPNNDLTTVCDYNSPEVSGDLNKLQMMTAIDFDSDRYARYTIHESEMKDYVRSISFQNCIEYCAEKYIKNKVVLVIRSGIGLLPMLCIRKGFAKKVIALEQSACIEYARRIVKDNCFSDKITFIQSSVHDLKDLPYGLKEVDVIVSDFMGDCVLSQGNEMEEVIEARDRFLKPNGLMIPMKVALYSQLLEQRTVYENQRIQKYKNKKSNKITSKKKLDQFEVEAYDTDSSSDSTRCSWWSNVYGFDMRSKPEIIVDHNSQDADSDEVEWCVMEEPLVTFFDPCKVVSTPCLIKEFDMYKCTIADVRLVQCKDLKFKCITPFTSAAGGDYAHMLEMFMVVDFPNGYDESDNADDLEIGFSTSSFSPQTRYRQTGLLLRDQLIVNKGDEFIINEFHMWRGHQQNQVNNPFEKTHINISSCNNSQHEENLKLRLRYTFVNKYMKAINRGCAYTITRILF